jgi:hypothetical protein
MTKVVRAKGEVEVKVEAKVEVEVKVEAGVETADKHVDKHVDKDLMRKHLMCKDLMRKNWRSKSPILKDLSKGLIHITVRRPTGRIPRSGHARARGKKKPTTMHQIWNLYTMVTALKIPLLGPFQNPVLLLLRFLHFPVQQESKQAITATMATMATTVTLATIFNKATAWTVLTRTVSFDSRIMGRNPC